jgi:magnesium transporter
MKMISRYTKKIGLPPGTVVHTGDQKIKAAKVSMMHYSGASCEEQALDAETDFTSLATLKGVTWINIDGLHDVSLIQRVGTAFDLHPLILEDVTNIGQRPKFEEYGDRLFVILPMISFDDHKMAIDVEQISLVFGKGFVLSFQERSGDVLDCVRERIRHGAGRLRKEGSDYLAYGLIDAIVDNYYLVLERMGDKIELLGDELIGDPDETTLYRIHDLKREMIGLRRSIWPLRELVNGLIRSESLLIGKTTRMYVRDVYDHTVQIIDTLESYRDMASSMLDIYLSSVSNKMNVVMKVLTIISTLFIPLSFIAGVYGMNFRYMPELQWRWAYPTFWLLCFLILIGMLIFFRKKRWI